MTLNVLLEFTVRDNGPQGDKILDMIEQNCKAHELFLVGWQRKGEKIRIQSKFSDILDAIDTKQFTPTQLEMIHYEYLNTSGENID